MRREKVDSHNFYFYDDHYHGHTCVDLVHFSNNSKFEKLWEFLAHARGYDSVTDRFYTRHMGNLVGVDLGGNIGKIAVRVRAADTEKCPIPTDLSFLAGRRRSRRYASVGEISNSEN